MSTCPNSCPNQAVLQQYWSRRYTTPGLTPASLLRQVDTDMDHFPYSRFYRGIYDCDRPRVMDREAGFRRLRPQAYAPYTPDAPPPPPPYSGCFQIACSTILPCVPNTSAPLYKASGSNCVTISP